MKDHVYYIVERGRIEKAFVRDSTIDDECFDVKFEGRDYYSLIRKGLFLQRASTSKKEAMRMLMEDLKKKKAQIEIESKEIKKQIGELCREMMKI